MEILFKVFSKVYKIYEDEEEQQEKANASLSKEGSANQNNNSNTLIESKKIPRHFTAAGHNKNETN